MRITRLPNLNGKHDALPANKKPSASQIQAVRRLFQTSGGTGLMLATHLQALDRLDSQSSTYAHFDSDHGDHRQTVLPDGTQIALKPSELCLFGVDDTRAALRDVARRAPAFARQHRRQLRGITVAQTNRRGAAQVRPIGLLQYDLAIAQVIARVNQVLDEFYPPTASRGANLALVHAAQAARVQAELPLLDVHIASSMGGQGSATFLTHAYVSRWLMDQRKARNVMRLGVLLGPRAFQGRGSLANYAATLHEIDRAYRDGFRHVLLNGDVIEYGVPPFDLLFLVDLPEPMLRATQGGAGREADKLSDAAMDDWLRQVALGIHLLTSRVMHDRLQSMLLNVQNSEAAGATLATFNAALVNSNLNAIEDVVALQATQAALQGLIERCRDV
jgi:hypothetical protein